MANKPLKSIQFPGLSDTYTVPQVDATLATSGAAADAKKVGDEISDLKQDFDQFQTLDHPEMGAGYASQLMSSLRKSDSMPYNFRKVPYDSTLEDGCIVGASVVVNQLVQKTDFASKTSYEVVGTNNGDGTYTVNGTATGGNFDVYVSKNVTANHVYYICGCPSGGSGSTYYIYYRQAKEIGGGIIKKWESAGTTSFDIVVTNGVTANNLKFTPQFFDLTLMLGTAIADYVYSLETATAGSGVAWLKEHFPKQFDNGYQAYNAGEIKSISGLAAHKGIGFNQWDEEWELGWIDNTGANRASTNNIRSKNYINVLPNTQYYFKTPQVGVFVYFDADKNCLGNVDANNRGDISVPGAVRTTPSNCRYIRFWLTSGTTYNHDICINISKPTGTPKNGDYVAYEEHSYALDSTKTFRGILKLDSNNKLYADGDEYLPEGKKDERFNEVDLGSLDWESISSPDSHIFRAPLADAKPSSTTQSAQNNPANAMMSNGYEVKGFTPISASDDKHFAIGFASGLDTMRLVVIDLSQSSTSSFKTAMTGVHLVYEKMTATTETAEPYSNPQIINPDGTESYVYTDGAFELPVGHESEYPVNVSGQLDDILDTPTTNGTYTLQATVTDGVVAYEWVSTT